jgi:hypothetical protein
MKSITKITWWFLLLGACCLRPSLHAESNLQVLVKYEVFRLPQAEADTLQSPKPSDAALYSALKRAVATGSVQADKMILMRTLLGKDSAMRQIDEFIHPEEAPSEEFLETWLGEELEISSVSSKEDAGRQLNVRGSTTQLVSPKASPPTFARSAIAATLPVTADGPQLLGRLHPESLPAAASASVILAFATPTVRQFPAQNQPSTQTPQRFRAQFEVISLPQAAAAELLSDTPDSPELYGKLQNLITAKSATLETLQLLRTKTGEEVKVAHVNEFPLGSDFDASRTPVHLTITDPVLRALLSKPAASPSPLPPPNAGSSVLIPRQPSTFGVRTIGDTLKLGSQLLADGSSMVVTINAEKTRFLAMQHYDGRDLPCFGQQTLKTQVRMELHTPLLLGTMNRPVKSGHPDSAPEDRVWLAFLTVRE